MEKNIVGRWLTGRELSTLLIIYSVKVHIHTNLYKFTVYTKLDMFRSDSQLSVISGSLLLNRNVTLLTGRSMV